MIIIKGTIREFYLYLFVVVVKEVCTWSVIWWRGV